MLAVAGPTKRIILTFVNTVRLDFVTTWVARVRRLGLTNWLVGATDAGAVNARFPQFGLQEGEHEALFLGDFVPCTPSVAPVDMGNVDTGVNENSPDPTTQLDFSALPY